MSYTLRPTLYGNESIVHYNGNDIGSVARVNGKFYATHFNGNTDVELKGFYSSRGDAIVAVIAESERKGK